jgi:hypothetical protein
MIDAVLGVVLFAGMFFLSRFFYRMGARSKEVDIACEMLRNNEIEIRGYVFKVTAHEAE